MHEHESSAAPDARGPGGAGLDPLLLHGAQVFETVNYGVVITDARRPDHPLLYCNRGFELNTGYSREEVLGLNCRFLQYSRDGRPVPENAPVRAMIRRALATCEPCDVVLRNFRRDGMPFWNHLYIAPLRDARGVVTHFIGTQFDLTDQVEAERALRDARNDLERRVGERTEQLQRVNESLQHEIVQHRQAVVALRAAEERYRGFFENAVVGIYRSTPEGLYLEVNGALARMYGYDSAEQLKAAVANIAGEIYAEPGTRAEFIRRIEAEGEVRGMEYRVRRRDGSFLWVSDHGRAVRDAAGRIERYEGIVRDITPRKLAEEERGRLVAQLNEAQKMEAIGTLAGGIAHDFNNILGAIIGYTELAISDLPADSAPRQSLDEVMQASERARELIQHILSFSRRATPERKPIHVRPILREVARLMRAALPSTIRVAADTKAVHDRIVADPIQVHQVLMNLCTNAGHAMQAHGGTLTLSLVDSPAGTAGAPEELGAGRHVVIVVSDTGAGMTPAVQARIFEPFFTTKPVGEGTGLGLSVVHGIVKAHGGAIAVESRLGVGTTFRLFWPATDNAAAATAGGPKEPLRTGNEAILLVDDDTALLAALGQQLRRLNYRVRTCRDSRRALVLLQEDAQCWDLVITDQTMPQLLGLGLAQEVAKLRPELPVLLCSGNLEHVDTKAARAAGVREILAKPITSAALSAALRRVFDRDEAIGPV